MDANIQGRFCPIVSIGPVATYTIIHNKEGIVNKNAL